jgi:hypothetical protein
MPQKNHEKSERPMFHQKCCFTSDFTTNFTTRQVAELEVQMAEVLSIAVRIVSGLVSGRDLCRFLLHGTARDAWHGMIFNLSLLHIYIYTYECVYT